MVGIGDTGGRIGNTAVPREDLVGGLHQASLHLVGRECRLGFQQIGHGAADHGRSHAGSAQREVLVGDDVLRVFLCERGDSVAVQRDHQVAGGNDVRLHNVIDRGRALGAVAGDQVVASGGRAHALHSAHGDHVGIVAGSGDRGVAISTGGIVPAIVAGGHYNNDAGIPSLLDRLAERILRIALVHRAAKRKVDYADIVDGLQGDGGLDGVDDGAVLPCPIAIQHAEIQDGSVGCDSLVEPLRGMSVAGDDAGNMRAVAPGIHRACIAGEEA